MLCVVPVDNRFVFCGRVKQGRIPIHDGEEKLKKTNIVDKTKQTFFFFVWYTSNKNINFTNSWNEYTIRPWSSDHHQMPSDILKYSSLLHKFTSIIQKTTIVVKY